MLEWKQAQSTGLSKPVLMFDLSNGPCKLAPLRPEIHIFSRTHRFSIRQVIQKNVPKGSFDFCALQTQLYFIPARMTWRIGESSERDVRAWRGNGAENSSQSKGREGSRGGSGRGRASSWPVLGSAVSLPQEGGAGSQQEKVLLPLRLVPPPPSPLDHTTVDSLAQQLA